MKHLEYIIYLNIILISGKHANPAPLDELNVNINITALEPSKAISGNENDDYFMGYQNYNERMRIRPMHKPYKNKYKPDKWRIGKFKNNALEPSKAITGNGNNNYFRRYQNYTKMKQIRPMHKLYRNKYKKKIYAKADKLRIGKLKNNDLYDVVNVETFSDDMISNLLQAVRKVQNSPDWNLIASIHGDPVRPKCNYRYCCIHERSGGFLPWHRIYQHRWNNALRKHKAGLGMPYWDWTTSEFPSVVKFPQIKDPKTGQTVENSLFNGFKKYTNEDTTRNKTKEPLNENLEVVLNALKEDDFALFSAQTQLVHNNVHDRVGGDMGTIATASYDPVFFMHHAFVDLIWAVYQKLKPNSLPSSDILKRKRDMVPFSHRIYQTLDYEKTFGYTYNLNINSDSIVFGGMTLAEIKTQITDNGDYKDYSDKMYAGFFLKSFQTSGKIKYNCCNMNDCSHTCGKVTIFGGPKQTPYIASIPTKYDVTDTVKKERIPFDNLRFKVIGFEDLKGNKLPMDIYQPIGVLRPANKGKDVYKIFFNKHYKQPPVIRVPKICSIRIDSSHKNIFQTQDKYIFHHCNQNGSSVVPSGKQMDINPGNYYFFDKDCNSGSSIHIIKE